MYCSTTANGKSQTSEKIYFNGAKMVKFAVKSDYNVAPRRCWFDNLKIQRLTAGETEPFDPTAIDVVKANTAVKAEGIYNLAGQKVNSNYKGLVIINGKKVVLK